MDKLTEEVVTRIVAKYDSLIAELQEVHNANKEFVEQANQNPNHPDIIAWAVFARENLEKLQQAKAELNSFLLKYLSK